MAGGTSRSGRGSLSATRTSLQLLQVGLDGLHPLRSEVVDPPSALRFLCHHAGVFQQAEVARNGGAADGHRLNDLPDWLVAIAEKAQDFASIGITESLKGDLRGHVPMVRFHAQVRH